MKKLILVLFATMLSFVAGAQGMFCLGPKIGYNSNTLTDNLDSIRSNMKNSFQIGAFMRVGKKVYFQPEVNYQVVKGTMNEGSGTYAQSRDYRLRTIKIPALIGLKLINQGIFNVRVMAGPAFTFAFNKKLDPSVMGKSWPVQTVDDLKNSIWSVQFGAGVDVLFLTLDVRYEAGVENMYNGNSDFNLKNNTFNVSLGVKLL